MKNPRILLTVAAIALTTHTSPSQEAPAVGGEKQWKVGDGLTVTLPETFQEGVPFPVVMDFSKVPPTPQKINAGFDCLGAKGKFNPKIDAKVTIPPAAGQSKGLREISQPERIVAEAVVTKAPEDITALIFTMYLSPEGAWKDRTVQAILPIKPASGTDDKVWEKAVQTALGQDGTPPDGEQGVEAYTPRTEFFTQRADDPEARGWKVAPQSLPALQSIVEAPGQDRPVYGVYSWVDEYRRAAAEIAKIGIKSLRLAGPWENADEAMKLASENGVEVLFTLKSGASKENYKKKRNDFESDDAFIEAFKQNVAAFVKQYGPGGGFEKSTGLKSPVAVVEMWNEPNFFYMIDDLPVRKDSEPLREALYPKVLRAGFETSKSIAPDLKVAGFAAGGADMADIRFIKNIFEQNPDIGNSFDILTTHPYNKGAPPESERVRKWGTYSIANALAQIRAAEGPAAAAKPIWYSELGWHFAGKHGGQFETPKDRLQDVIPPDLHAAYVTRMYIWAMRLGVPRVHIMHLHDADAFNGGFLNRPDLAWRPVAHATKTMIDLLPNPKILGAVSDGGNNTWAYRLKADHKDPASKEIIYAWNTLGPATLEIPCDKPSVEIVDMVGNRKSVPAAGGKVSLEVGPYPVYIIL